MLAKKRAKNAARRPRSAKGIAAKKAEDEAIAAEEAAPITARVERFSKEGIAALKAKKAAEAEAAAV